MKKYVVALLTGGVPEQPNFAYEDYQVIVKQTMKKRRKIFMITSMIVNIILDIV